MSLTTVKSVLARAEARAALAALAALAATLAAPTSASAQRLRGYGEFHFRFHDHGPDQTQEGGAPPDRRLVFDTTRLVLELEKEVAPDVEIEAEIEFEHGGTGVELELEYEEFGEFESEVEKGGEVILEQLFVEWAPTECLSLKVGRFYVALGLLYRLHRPTDYLGAGRAEGETRLLPAVWHEQGAAASLHLGDLDFELQLVSGLDSTGFSSQQWIARGQQARFAQVRATALALVGRVDYTGIAGLTVGASSYVGDTVPNRPKPDMKGTFAPLVLADVHAAYDGARVRGRAVAIWGYLAQAPAISEKNRRLSNNLGVLRSPVASQGLAAWAEVGVDLAPSLGLAVRHRIEPFLHVERYDTMFATDGAQVFDDPRFQRTILAFGAAYTFGGTLVATLEASHRRLGSAALRRENTVELSFGFTY